MTITVRRVIQEAPSAVPGAGRLGRNVLMDSRSRAYRLAGRIHGEPELYSVRHQRHIPVIDQGDLGSCTGQAATGNLGSDWCYPPLIGHRPGIALGRGLGEQLYSRATVLDDLEGIDGVWPPEDTGSTVLSACKAAKEAGYCSGYLWAFGLAECLAGLTIGPVIIGINWYSSFDAPGPDGLIGISGTSYVRGGHAVCLDEIDVERERVWFTNSWGVGWGKGGRACMTWATLDRLLREQGEAVALVPLDEAAPVPEPVPEPADVGWVSEALAAVWRFLRWLFGGGWLSPRGGAGRPPGV